MVARGTLVEACISPAKVEIVVCEGLEFKNVEVELGGAVAGGGRPESWGVGVAADIFLVLHFQNPTRGRTM